MTSLIRGYRNSLKGVLQDIADSVDDRQEDGYSYIAIILNAISLKMLVTNFR